MRTFTWGTPIAYAPPGGTKAPHKGRVSPNEYPSCLRRRPPRGHCSAVRIIFALAVPLISVRHLLIELSFLPRASALMVSGCQSFASGQRVSPGQWAPHTDLGR